MPSADSQDFLWIAVGDIHDEPERFAQIPELSQADGIIVTGDLTITGGVKQAELVMNALCVHDIPVLAQGRTARGIDVGNGVWLGTHVVVTDGSRVGRDAIIGAGAVVVGEIPEFAIAVGTPAKVIRDRRAEGAAPSPEARASGPEEA